MHSPSTPEEQHQRRLARDALRAVLTLPPKQTGIHDFPKPYGMPDLAHKLILDADIRRRRACHFGQAWPEKNDIKLYRRLAEIRGPGRELSTDPILWVLGIRERIRKATLAYVALQSGEPMEATPEISTWLTETSVYYKSLATRACRYWGIQPSDYQIYDKLLIQGQPGRCPSYRIPNHQTCHWILWDQVARGKLRSKAWDAAFAANFI